MSTQLSCGGFSDTRKTQSLKKLRNKKKVNHDENTKLSNTTSAYDTSSNLSNEGYINNICKEFQNRGKTHCFYLNCKF